MQESWTRRQVSGAAGSRRSASPGWAAARGVPVAAPGLAGGAAAPTPPHHPPGPRQPSAAPAQGRVDSFVTRNDLHPPVVSVTQGAGAGEGPYLFLAPRGYAGKSVGDSGLMIVDRTGQLVWFGSPISGTPLNFTRQVYRGQPVLTWSAGIVNAVGITFGTSYIADSSYKVIAKVKAGNGADTDLHEFNITPQDTALITAHRKIPADLSSVGGPKKGWLMTSNAQEIDIASGKVLFDWNSLDHVPLTESYQKLLGGTSSTPYDYFHINSVALAPDGDVIISSRNTWTIYKVSRSSGAVRWRLGGKKSDFTRGPGATFAWQHDARMPGADVLTLFDNASSPPEEPQSRGLMLNVDTKAMHVTLKQAFKHPAGLLADNQGSVQVQPDGRVLVGWGAQPYLSEFAADGSLVLDAELPLNDQSYRAFTFPWSGRPPGKPDVVAQPNPARGSAVFVSWNGATDVATWTVLAGKTASALAAAGSQPRAGFETKISVNSEGPFFAVTAHDASGRQVGRSATVRRSGAGTS